MEMPKILPNMVIKFRDEEMHTNRIAIVTGESGGVFFGYAVYRTDTRFENEHLCIANTVSVHPEDVLEVYVNKDYPLDWLDKPRMVFMTNAKNLRMLFTHPNMDDEELDDFRLRRIYVKGQIKKRPKDEVKEVTMSEVEEKFRCKVKIVGELSK